MQIDDAVARIRSLEQILGENYRSPPSWGLTQGENIILGLLMRRPVVSNDEMGLFLSEIGHACQPSNIKVAISKLRKKLHPYSIEISNRYGDGYSLTPASKALLRFRTGDGIGSELLEAERLTKDLRKLVSRLKGLVARFQNALEVAEVVLEDSDRFMEAARSSVAA